MRQVKNERRRENLRAREDMGTTSWGQLLLLFRLEKQKESRANLRLDDRPSLALCHALVLLPTSFAVLGVAAYKVLNRVGRKSKSDLIPHSPISGPGPMGWRSEREFCLFFPSSLHLPPSFLSLSCAVLSSPRLGCSMCCVVVGCCCRSLKEKDSYRRVE